MKRCFCMFSRKFQKSYNCHSNFAGLQTVALIFQIIFCFKLLNSPIEITNKKPFSKMTFTKYKELSDSELFSDNSYNLASHVPEPLLRFGYVLQ